MGKLGGYVAVPFDYQFEVDAMEEGDGPEIVAGECPPFPTYNTSTTTAKGVLALDTLGTDGEFKTNDCECAVEWTKRLGEGLGRIANEKVSAERDTRTEFKDKNVEQWTDMNAHCTAMEEELTALLETSKQEAHDQRAAAVPAPADGEEAAPVPDEDEADMRLREGKIRLTKLKEMVESKKEMVESLASRTDAASRHWQVLQSVLLLLKTAPGEVDSWEKCKAYVATEAFWTAFSSCDTSVAREVLTAQTGEAVKAAIEGVDAQAVDARTFRFLC